MYETTNFSNRSILHQLSVEKQIKLALNPFDHKRMYINPIKCLPWEKQTQQGDYPCLYSLKFILLYHKELTENKTDEQCI